MNWQAVEQPSGNRFGSIWNPSAPPINDSTTHEPSQKILLCDTQAEGGMGFPDWGGNWTNNSSRAFAPHTDQGNFLFLDGHVKSMRWSATDNTFNMWGNFNEKSTNDGPDCSRPDKSNDAAFTDINCDAPNIVQTTALSAIDKQFQ